MLYTTIDGIQKEIEELSFDLNYGVKKRTSDLKYKKGDRNSRILITQFYDNDMPFNLQGYNVRMYAIKPDETKVFDDCEIIDHEYGTIKITLKEQMLNVAGTVQCEFVLTAADGSLMSTPVFKIIVQDSIHDTQAIESSNEFNALLNAIDTVDGLDNRMEVLKTETGQEIAKTNAQLSDIKIEVEKPITLDKCDEALLGAIQNKDGETTFNLLSIPRDKSVDFEKLDTTISETLYELNNHDDTNVPKKGVVGTNDLYFVNKEYDDCVISNIKIKFTQPGVGEIRIYENVDGILSIAKIVEFDTTALKSLEPTIILNYKATKAYVGLTKTSGVVDFGAIGKYGMLAFAPKTDETFTVAEGNVFNQFSLPVKIETFKNNIVKRHELQNYATKEDLDNIRFDGKGTFVVVAKDGRGDYTTITEAVENYDGKPIFIRNGVYEEGRINCDDKAITMIGEDKNRTIIRNKNGLYGEDALYCSNGYFSNIQFIADYVKGESREIGSQNGAYAVHIDSNNQAGETCVFKDCIIISDFNAGVGNGLRKDNIVEFNNCDIISRQEGRGQSYSTGGMGALFTHNNHTGTGDNCPNQVIRLNNCRLKAKLQYVIKIQEINKTNAQAILDINNCLVFSETNGVTNVIKYGSVNNFDEMSIWRLSDTSFGNSAIELNKF